MALKSVVYPRGSMSKVMVSAKAIIADDRGVHKELSDKS
jgi:hypothetical protein